MTAMGLPGIQHLHTYFLFPFSVDRAVVGRNHKEIWSHHSHWIDGLDHWIGVHDGSEVGSALVQHLGPWKRAAYKRFEMNGPAYQDMVFFHPFVRRVFFDTGEEAVDAETNESLLRTYTIPIPAGQRLCFEADEATGRRTATDITDLRLFLFANGIGILSIGVEARDIAARDALWINESLRKVYPSSSRQIREGRIPSRFALSIDHDGVSQTIVEERFECCSMTGFLPPLSKIITSLIYFANYARGEFEPVLDERMLVYTYFALDPATLPEGFVASEEYQVLLSRFLYIDRAGPSYRYDPKFTRRLMRSQMYRRWAHQGTWYGFTSYSNITGVIGTFDCDEHKLGEGFLVHRMFDTRYYLMAIVALFYRATLLSFAERAALVSKGLYLDQDDGRLTPENIATANALRAEFLHFSNYWHFDELANKDEEVEHFAMQCRQYRITSMKNSIESELEKLDGSLQTYNQMRNTEAVNRVAMLSMILGAGAVLTGFFGMNFGREFASIFFDPKEGSALAHYIAVSVVGLLAFSALAFGVWVVAANWIDYRDILRPRLPRWKKQRTAQAGRGRRLTLWKLREPDPGPR